MPHPIVSLLYNPVGIGDCPHSFFGCYVPIILKNFRTVKATYMWQKCETEMFVRFVCFLLIGGKSC